MKLPTLKPLVGKLSTARMQQPEVSLKRGLTGRALQAMRFRLWQANPYCKGCGRLVAYPGGFELDHHVRVADGGTDDPSNLDILCIDEFDRGKGCHAVKTANENKGSRR